MCGCSRQEIEKDHRRIAKNANKLACLRVHHSPRMAKCASALAVLEAHFELAGATRREQRLSFARKNVPELRGAGVRSAARAPSYARSRVVASGGSKVCSCAHLWEARGRAVAPLRLVETTWNHLFLVEGRAWGEAKDPHTCRREGPRSVSRQPDRALAQGKRS